MSDRPPLPSSLSSQNSRQHEDPFADRARHAQFSEPQRPFRGNDNLNMPRPFESSTSLNEFGSDRYDDDDENIEKQPLNSGEANFAGGFYPPASDLVPSFSSLCIADIFYSPIDPNSFGRPVSVASSNGTENAWRRRQTIKRGVTRKVKLTNGNFVAEYPVPTPVLSAIEARYASTGTTEFS
jgi:chitin synthase